MDTNSGKQKIAREAKALVALAFRNGPIEDVHAGKPCPTCTGRPGYGRITDEEMKDIMKSAVDQLYRFLCLKNEDPQMYESEIRRGATYTTALDEPAGAPSDLQLRQDSPRHAEMPDSAVLVTMPLRAIHSAHHNSTQPYSFEQVRNRLEQIVSYIGFTVRQRGIASMFECKADDDALTLLLIGADVKTIRTEVLSYLHLFQLPDNSRMTVFTSGSPHEIKLN
jgi:hypothetical protein